MFEFDILPCYSVVSGAEQDVEDGLSTGRGQDIGTAYRVHELQETWNGKLSWLKGENFQAAQGEAW